MEAKEFMNQVRKLDLMITNKLIEVEQWKAMAANTTVASEGERVQASSSQQKMADAIAKYIDIQAEIDADIDRLVDTKQNVIRTIERLEPVEYDVLHKRYIQYMSLQDIATKYDRQYTWATTLHGQALASLQKILDAEGDANEIIHDGDKGQI